MNKLFGRMAIIFESFARYERANAKRQIAIALQSPETARLVKPCEGCLETQVYLGGLCPTCWELAAGAARMRGRDK